MNEQLQQALTAAKNGEEERARSILAALLKTQPDNVAGWILLSKLAQTEVQRVAFLRKVQELDPDNVYATAELALLEDEAPAGGPAAPVLAGSEMETSGEKLPAPRPTPLPAETVAEDDGEVAEEITAPATELPAEESAGEIQPAAAPLPAAEDELPAWLDDDGLPPWLEEEEEAPEGETVATAEQTPPAADLPDWVQEQPDQHWLDGEAAADPAAAPAADTGGEAGAGAGPAAEPVAAPTAAKSEPSRISPMIIGLGILLIIVFLVFVYTALSLF